MGSMAVVTTQLLYYSTELKTILCLGLDASWQSQLQYYYTGIVVIALCTLLSLRVPLLHVCVSFGDLEHNPNHVDSKVRPTVFFGSYSQERAFRIETKDSWFNASQS